MNKKNESTLGNHEKKGLELNAENITEKEDRNVKEIDWN